MSIRLRTVGGIRVALCAVESDPMPGDVYLDDADDHALRVKFVLDYQSEAPDHDPWWLLRIEHREEWAAMCTQKVRDAREEHEKWERAQHK